MPEKRKSLGIIINPVAGVGGSVGLKGSDGLQIQQLAKELGAVPEAPQRALSALLALAQNGQAFQVLTCPGDMGENECRDAGLNATVLDLPVHVPTVAEDTETAAHMMAERGVDLLLFAGGDGTARNIYAAVGEKIPAVGIPAGVKIHSAAFAKNPRCAGLLAARYLCGHTPGLRPQEVMDIDEDAYRSGRVSAKLYGYLSVPYEVEMVQKMKAGSLNEKSALNSIAAEIVDHMEDDCWYVIGAGTTTRCITDYLGLEKTLLGVDVLHRRKIVGRDMTEQGLLEALSGKRVKIIVTPIGGQGYLFGRGNQQLSSRVIKMAGTENIIVVATLQKIADLGGAPFFVDMKGAETLFPSYIRVVTGYRQQLVYPLAL